MAKSRDLASYADHQDALAAAGSELPRVLVATGEEEFLRQEALETLVDAFVRQHPQAETLTLRGAAPGGGGGDTLKTATVELGGTGLFVREKLVVFRQADRACFPGAGGEEDEAPGKTGADPAVRFLEALDRMGSGLWCWLELASLPRNRTLGKQLAERATVIPCPALRRPADQARWLRDRARSRNTELDAEAADLLLAIHGGRLGALAGELEKLSVHAGAGAPVTAEAVRTFFAGTAELDAFALSNAVEARDFPTALDLARKIGAQGLRDEKGKLTDGEGSARRALATVAMGMERLFSMRVLLAGGMGPEAAARRMGMLPSRASFAAAAARRYSLRELRLALTRLAETARAVNDTGGDIRLALETAVVAIVPRAPGRTRDG